VIRQVTSKGPPGDSSDSILRSSAARYDSSSFPSVSGTTVGAVFTAAHRGDPNRVLQVNHPRLPAGIGYFELSGFDPAKPPPLEIKSVNLTIKNDPLPTLVFEGKGLNDVLGPVQMSGSWGRQSGELLVKLELTNIPVDGRFIERLAARGVIGGYTCGASGGLQTAEADAWNVFVGDSSDGQLANVVSTNHVTSPSCVSVADNRAFDVVPMICGSASPYWTQTLYDAAPKTGVQMKSTLSGTSWSPSAGEIRYGESLSHSGLKGMSNWPSADSASSQPANCATTTQVT